MINAVLVVFVAPIVYFVYRANSAKDKPYSIAVVIAFVLSASCAFTCAFLAGVASLGDNRVMYLLLFVAVGALLLALDMYFQMCSIKFSILKSRNNSRKRELPTV